MNTKSWVSFHSYIPNFYIAENNFFYSGLNEGCDLLAIAVTESPDCEIDGYANLIYPATTTSTTSTSTTTTTTTLPPRTTTTTTTFTPEPETTTSTTTRAPFYSFLLNSTSGLPTGVSACLDYTVSFNRATFFTSAENGPTIVNGTFLYTSSSLLNSIPDGYYSDGTNFWNFQNGSTGTDATPCGQP
jgi:hypothetical protein